MKENVEEDIARIAKLITTKFNNDYSIDNKDKEAIEHILSDYKRVLKENEELKDTNTYLQKENEELKERIREHTLLISPYYVKENFIPVQKVKDKIEELQKGPLKINENNKYYYETEAYNKIIIQVLQELLEGRK
ncbi:unknown [Clostridium sp. CAG:470]|nr:unknown [Clostridium sp. CAG:470]